jgi:acyl-coenzyme A synthetase/AMP-(fatty) acid ligase
VSVREVESVLLTHPAVSEALVVGRPHSLMGAVPHAIVSLADGSEASPRALVEHCRAHLAPHKVPMTVEVVLEFERSSAGKVKRFSYR